MKFFVAEKMEVERKCTAETAVRHEERETEGRRDRFLEDQGKHLGNENYERSTCENVVTDFGATAGRADRKRSLSSPAAVITVTDFDGCELSRNVQSPNEEVVTQQECQLYSADCNKRKYTHDYVLRKGDDFECSLSHRDSSVRENRELRAEADQGTNTNSRIGHSSAAEDIEGTMLINPHVERNFNDAFSDLLKYVTF